MPLFTPSLRNWQRRWVCFSDDSIVKRHYLFLNPKAAKSAVRFVLITRVGISFTARNIGFNQSDKTSTYASLVGKPITFETGFAGNSGVRRAMYFRRQQKKTRFS